MPQLHCYVSDDVARQVRKTAESRGLSVSRFIAGLVRDAVHTDWPTGYFDRVFGGWQGELVREPQGELEEREEM